MTPAGYEYTLNSRCIASLLQAGDESDRMERIFSMLAATPFGLGDYQEIDGHGRAVQVILHEHWVISFWTDHAAKQAHIIDLEDVG